MWAIVEIQDTNTKEKESFKIVGSTESDILAETPMISNDSPIWKILLWKKKWDKVKVEVHSNSFEYQILSVN